MALLSSLVVAGLVIGVIAIGDRVGVRIEEAYPVGLATETSLVSFRFSESMDRSSVAERFTSDPEVEGEISWRRERMVFQPRGKLKPGTEYRFAIGRGAQGQSGREVLEDYEITFLVSDSSFYSREGTRSASLTSGRSTLPTPRPPPVDPQHRRCRRVRTRP